MATFIEQDKAAAANAATPEDVYASKLGTPGFNKVPHCIYFTYIGKEDGARHNKILHYYDRGDDQPIDTPTKLEQRLAALISNARRDIGDQYPPPIAEDWRHLVFDRISYVAFAFDFAMTTEPAFAVEYAGAPHHSFYDGQMLQIEGCKVGVCVNHLKRAPGGIDLERETQPFLFRLAANPQITWEGMPQYPESGGTNQGPGAPPPE